MVIQQMANIVTEMQNQIRQERQEIRQDRLEIRQEIRQARLGRQQQQQPLPPPPPPAPPSYINKYISLLHIKALRVTCRSAIHESRSSVLLSMDRPRPSRAAPQQLLLQLRSPRRSPPSPTSPPNLMGSRRQTRPLCHQGAPLHPIPNVAPTPITDSEPTSHVDTARGGDGGDTGVAISEAAR
jgi:hypothetical protein